jgi:hypothetical protein
MIGPGNGCPCNFAEQLCSIVLRLSQFPKEWKERGHLSRPAHCRFQLGVDAESDTEIELPHRDLCHRPFCADGELSTSIALSVAAVRDSTPSTAKIFMRCLFTVWSLMPRMVAISGLFSPPAAGRQLQAALVFSGPAAQSRRRMNRRNPRLTPRIRRPSCEP